MLIRLLSFTLYRVLMRSMSSPVGRGPLAPCFDDTDFISVLTVLDATVKPKIPFVFTVKRRFLSTVGCVSVLSVTFWRTTLTKKQSVGSHALTAHTGFGERPSSHGRGVVTTGTAASSCDVPRTEFLRSVGARLSGGSTLRTPLDEKSIVIIMSELVVK